MLVLSHRGYHVTAPENTLEAFAQAVALGVDGIETDLRLSVDGKIVLFHDRAVDDGRTVAELTHKELCSVVGFEVATLAAALESWPEILWNLEIKAAAALEPAIAAVQKLPSGTRLLITSFRHPLVEEFGARCAVECGLLISHCPANAAASLASLSATSRARTLVWNFEFTDPQTLEQARYAGFRNFVYGIATPKEHQECRAWPLDGVITDRPEFLR